MMSVSPGATGTTPPPSAAPGARNGTGVEGIEGFAALLAGAMVPPQGRTPTPPPRPGLGPGGSDASSEATAPSEGDGAGPFADALLEASEAGDTAVDPRSFLLRAGLGRTPGEASGAPSPLQAAGAQMASAGADLRQPRTAPGVPLEGPTPPSDAVVEVPGGTVGDPDAVVEVPEGAMANPESVLAPADVRMTNRDTARLDPTFRSRLERVMERLQSEHGIESRLVEGFRPQLRQEHLYAQGRSAPGPVVTWTLNSMHSQGRAADLKLEGGMENYRIMHEVAAQEGLRTLGMRDPGHLELGRTPGEILHGGDSSGSRRAGQGMMSGAVTQGLPAQVASGALAPTAQGVAQVARVARVAVPAVPGAYQTFSVTSGSGRGGPDLLAARPATLGERTSDTADAMVEALPADGSETSGGTRGNAPLPEIGVAQVRTPAAPGGGLAAVDRIAALEELRASAPAGPVRRIDLRDADGQGTRIRIEMKGDSVRADIRTPDADLARRLEPALSDLQGALERHGLELGRLRVARTPEVVTMRDPVQLPQDLHRGSGGEDDASRSSHHESPDHRDDPHHNPRHRNRPDGSPDRENQP